MSVVVCECGTYIDTDFNVEVWREYADKAICDSCWEGSEDEQIAAYIDGDITAGELGNWLMSNGYKVDEAGARIQEVRERFMNYPTELLDKEALAETGKGVVV